jgi:hypothetical protein
MSQSQALDDFVRTILRNLDKNGYPARSVAFPLEKMYESASARGFSFNKIRDILKEHGIVTELTEHRVIFSPAAAEAPDLDVQNIAEAAQQILQSMSMDERTRLEEMMRSMDPGQMQQVQQHWEAMPEEEKQRLIAHMKKNGLPT